MSSRLLWRRLSEHANRDPQAVALSDGHDVQVCYGELSIRVEAAVRILRAQSCRCLGILADNGPEWMIWDLAALAAGISCVPLPLFFSDSQLLRSLRTSGVDTVITDQPERLNALVGQVDRLDVPALKLSLMGITPTCEPKGFDKVTFTSGTTGEPKGVCLESAALIAIANVLQNETKMGSEDIHLCALPLSVLLENIGGVYRTLLANGRIELPKLSEVGLVGSSSLDPKRLVTAIQRTRATSLITMPEMLRALVVEAECGRAPQPRSLRFLGVGGAHVSSKLLERAHHCGIPAYEGYGISECGSVIALNTPGSWRAGSCGKTLPNRELKVDPQGRLWVRGLLSPGYLKEEGFELMPLDSDGFMATGDLGRVDESGFVWIEGRVKNQIITSFGRNICPEWIEAELCSDDAVKQARVVGEGRSHLEAYIRCDDADVCRVEKHIKEMNTRLPDYAQVVDWHRE